MALTLVICLGFYVVSGSVAAYSSLLGGIIFVIPQLYFGIKAFLHTGARSAQKIVINFYKGESSKLIFIALGFALVFKFVDPLDYLAFYTTFISVLFLNCFTAALTDR
jgi:ATP synthase protein I